MARKLLPRFQVKLKGRGRTVRPGTTEGSTDCVTSLPHPFAESTTSQMGKETFIIGSTMTSSFVLEDLLQASAEVLGKGTAGSTYKASIEGGYTVVVKRLAEVDLSEEEFDLRVVAIGAIQNKHIAPLEWYYWSKDEKLLVYNYFSNGSLDGMLHGHQGAGRTPLGWEEQATIALSVARGVAYIHSAGPSSCHGNIKSSNIMLKLTLDACVSEHGLAALGPFCGAHAYSAPEITDARQVSQKADVYSFGVLLLELLTGKHPARNTQLDEEGVNLPQWVSSLAQHEWVVKVIDVQLLAQQQKDGEEECMVQLLQLAIHCCNEDADSRTTMSDVVQQIEKIMG